LFHVKPALTPKTPSAPELARRVFADRIVKAEAFADLLAGEATVRGLIGPREVPRLWERHLVN
jgi:16S rRNA (guanine527-N7)-methyltransferase